MICQPLATFFASSTSDLALSGSFIHRRLQYSSEKCYHSSLVIWLQRVLYGTIVLNSRAGAGPAPFLWARWGKAQG